MIQRSRRIAHRSARAIANLPLRAQVVDLVFDRDRGRCQAETKVPLIRCGGPLDPHEIIPRSVWPGGELVPANVTMVCRRHHDWIGDNPTAAHDLGLHGYSWERSS